MLENNRFREKALRFPWGSSGCLSRSLSRNFGWSIKISETIGCWNVARKIRWNFARNTARGVSGRNSRNVAWRVKRAVGWCSSGCDTGSFTRRVNWSLAGGTTGATTRTIAWRIARRLTQWVIRRMFVRLDDRIKDSGWR